MEKCYPCPPTFLLPISPAGQHAVSIENGARGSNIRAITVRMRGRHHQECNWFGRLVHKLMLRAGRDFEPLTCLEFESRTIHLENRLPLQYVEKLPRARVEVPTFSVSGRNTLLDHAELTAIEQMPTFAASTPLVSFARADVDDA